VHIRRDQPGSVGSHNFRGDLIILSHSLDLKEENETSLGSAMSWVRPADLNNLNMSVKCSHPEITQDRFDCMIAEGNLICEII
jgi:hypothetical protein